jgi:hypothetical protein
MLKIIIINNINREINNISWQSASLDKAIIDKTLDDIEIKASDNIKKIIAERNTSFQEALFHPSTQDIINDPIPLILIAESIQGDIQMQQAILASQQQNENIQNEESDEEMKLAISLSLQDITTQNQNINLQVHQPQGILQLQDGDIQDQHIAQARAISMPATETNQSDQNNGAYEQLTGDCDQMQP